MTVEFYCDPSWHNPTGGVQCIVCGTVTGRFSVGADETERLRNLRGSPMHRIIEADREEPQP